MTLDQIFILFSSCVAIFCISNKWLKTGFWIGLVGQPFWFYSSIKNAQYGIFLLSFWYAGCYIWGLIKEYKKPDEKWTGI